MFTVWSIVATRKRAAKASCRILFVSLALLCAAGLRAEDNPPGRVGRISYLKGKVSFLPAGQDQWSEATLNYVVTTGDRIYTDEGARAEIEVGPYTVRLSGKTDLAITNLTDKVMQLGVDRGTMRLSVYHLRSGDTVEADTPNGALTVLSDGKYRVEVRPDDNVTLAVVNRGRLQVTGGELSQTIDAGQAVKLSAPPKVEQVSAPAADSFDQWCEERDQRVDSSVSSKYVSSFTPGYEDLDGYGRWVVGTAYGSVWFPTVAADWVPYRIGHWAWIDPWGWTWIDDEPWGFAPFHFGRWVLIGGVWGWVPGPIAVVPVFAPAFVAFVGPSLSISVSVGWVGWFPLGPDEPFFPWYFYTADYLRVINITNVRNVTNIQNIINVKNVNQIHYRYRTIATTAVPPDVFRNGLPVAHHGITIPREQLAKAPIIPHPPLNPTARAAMPGRPVSHPPVRSVPTVASSRLPQGAPAPGERRAPPQPARETPSQSVEKHTEPPSHRLITRMEPPPTPLPFSEVRPALDAHPGRPLEPAQLENLREGRPVGPMIGREFPPHIAPMGKAERVSRPHR